MCLNVITHLHDAGEEKLEECENGIDTREKKSVKKERFDKVFFNVFKINFMV